MGRLLRLVEQAVEVEPEVAVRLHPLVLDDRVDRALVDLEQRPAGGAERVERAGLDQRLDGALVRDAERHLAQEVVEGGEAALLVARGDDLLDDVRPDVPDRAHAEADVLADGGEEADRLVHVGRQDPDLHPAALVQVHRELVAGVADGREQGGHVLGRVVRLQVRGPVRQDAVRGRVGLVERVVRERQQDVPERVHGLVGVAALVHARLEAGELLVQLRLLLLAHRAAEDVGLAEREAGELLRDRHDLLLVHDQAERGAEHVLQRLRELRVDRDDLLQPVLPQRVVRVRVRAHRARAVQRADRGDVLEVVGLHQPQQGPHRAAVELEHPEGVARGEELVRQLVGERQVLEHRAVTAVRLDVVERVLDDREVPEAQEVHLDQAQRLAGRVVELRDDLAVLLAALDRDHVGERDARHDHAAGVDAPLPLQPLEPERGVEDGLGLRVHLDDGPDVAGLLVALVLRVEDPGQRDVLAHDRGRHRLRELLPHPEGEAEHATGVLEGLLRLDRAVGDDLADPVVAVLVGDVAEHLVAPALVEVDVEVGHGDAVGVEEALEDQAVLQRVEVGDAHRVGGHRAGARAAARADADAVVLRPVDEVGDDEEVAGEAHLQDDGLLVLGLLAHRLRHAVRVADLEAAVDLLDEPGVLGLPLRHREPGHVVRVRVELDLAALGDDERVVARLGQVAEDVPHLRRRLQVVLVAVELEAVRVVERRAGLDAEQRRVALRVLRVRVVQVVRRDDRQRQLLREAEQVLLHPALDRDAVVHQLDEEVVLAEDVAELRGGRDRLVPLPEAEAGLHLAAGAAGGRDEALVVLVKQLPVHAGLEVVALDRRPRRQLEQVVQAGRALREQRHVGVRAGARHVVAAAVAPPDAGLVAAVRARREVGLRADDRLHAVLLGLLPEVERAEGVAVVGDRDRRHALLGGLAQHVAEAGGTVEHRVLGVHVEVDEAVGGTHGGSTLAGASDSGEAA